MGKAIIVRDGILNENNINARTLQSAYSNGVLADAKVLNTDDPFHEINQPHLVDTTTQNIPADLSWGIREVYFKAVGTAVLLITGITTSGTAAIWSASVTKVNSTVTVGSWNSFSAPFVGATSSVAGSAGTVPAPTTADVGKVLTNEGWGFPKRTLPISSIAKGNNDVITLTYTDGSYETLTQVDDSHYSVKEYDSSDTLLRTYTTTVDAAGNVSVVVTE